jgi:hypothetical protein
MEHRRPRAKQEGIASISVGQGPPKPKALLHPDPIERRRTFLWHHRPVKPPVVVRRRRVHEAHRRVSADEVCHRRQVQRVAGSINAVLQSGQRAAKPGPNRCCSAGGRAGLGRVGRSYGLALRTVWPSDRKELAAQPHRHKVAVNEHDAKAPFPERRSVKKANSISLRMRKVS